MVGTGSEIKSFYTGEIALMEHQFIHDQNILEFGAENLRWYLAGVHDFAELIIQKIMEKEGF